MTTLCRPMKSRIAVLTTLLVLLVAAPAAAQGGAFGPLPPATTPTPEAVGNPADDGELSTTLLFGIGGLLILGFGVMGWFIMRDARTAAPTPELAGPNLREHSARKHKQRAKQKARAKGRAQRQARKAHRKR
jgi:hypothetical protein